MLKTQRRSAGETLTWGGGGAPLGATKKKDEKLDY